MIPRGRQQPVDDTRDTLPPDGRPASEQPKWRRDFPIESAQDEYVSRRDLVKFLVLTSAAFAAGQFYIGMRSLFRRPRSLPRTAVAQVASLAVGEAVSFEYPEGSTPRLLIRTGEQSFVAYDQQCTHLMCPVVPEVQSGRLHCPCHNGWFDLATGVPLQGPPRRPLSRIHLEVSDGIVYATGIEERPP